MNGWMNGWMNEWMGGWMTFGGRLKLTICWAIFQIFDFLGTTEADDLLGDPAGYPVSQRQNLLRMGLCFDLIRLPGEILAPGSLCSFLVGAFRLYWHISPHRNAIHSRRRIS